MKYEIEKELRKYENSLRIWARKMKIKICALDNLSLKGQRQIVIIWAPDGATFQDKVCDTW